NDTSDDDNKRTRKFKEGEKVEAQYKGKAKFYPGVIARARLNGTYDIDYDDGEKEKEVAADLIRSKEAASPKKKKPADTSDDEKKPKKFKEGEKVEAQYKGKAKFYPGVISRARLNGTYDIDYDDGEKEMGVAAGLIRSKDKSSPKKKSSDSDDDKKSKKFKEGEKIEAQYKGKAKYYPGVISRARLNGTYDIDYDDGEKEKEVAAELIRSKELSSPKKKKSDDTSEEDKKPKKFKEGEKVEAQYKGKAKFYPGVISRARLNGTYDIDYDDGEKETGVAADLIRSKDKSSPKKKSNDSDDDKKSKKFKEGEKVEAQYKGKSKFYPGVISRARLNGTYDIDYDDGEKEKEVAADLIRSKEKSSPKKKSEDTTEDEKKSKKFKEGEKVEAQYKGKAKFYPGVISRARLNGTYDIDYDDGEKETGVAAELIRSKDKSSPKKKSSDDTTDDDVKKFKEGDKVECLYKGKTKYFPGVIARARLNGTYDIDYDDGEKEKEVAAKLIRSREKSSSPKKKANDTSDDDNKRTRKFKEGEKVEAQYKGKSKFYPGVIARARLNGTYDIDYDDGEKETGVAADMIRAKESATPKKPSEPSGENYRVGTKVEALYKGTISKDHGDGRYDVEYDDGDKEAKVPAKMIRPVKSSGTGRANFQKLVGGTKKSKSGNSSD
ncbi:hypothetical protein DYB38_001936, partial [Aphanomyces astaci]